MTQEARIVGILFGALGENFYRFFIMTKVGGASPEPDQIVGSRVSLGVFPGVGKFTFEVAPRFSRELRANLLCPFQTVLTKSGRTTDYEECQTKKSHIGVAVCGSRCSLYIGTMAEILTERDVSRNQSEDSIFQSFWIGGFECSTHRL